jgi:hypothetical protein
MTRECFGCKHWRKGSDPIACDAFPEGIPAPILTGSVSHATAYHGDGGMRYEPGTPQKAVVATVLQEVTR